VTEKRGADDETLPRRFQVADFTSCPPIERAEMSNSEPSAIVLQGIACIGGVYINFDSNGEIGSLKVRRNSPFLDRA
jgi:hypothetical protein